MAERTDLLESFFNGSVKVRTREQRGSWGRGRVGGHGRVGPRWGHPRWGVKG
jgi:hypothetical protein